MPRKSVLPDAPLSLPSPQRDPVWRGPVEDGITQTMLSRYLTCPERFRVMYVEGLQPAPSFRPQLEFGNLWHAAEEAHAHGEKQWDRFVYDYGNKLGDIYPMQKDQIIHWIRVTIALFPLYVHHWKTHPDVINRKPLLQEEKFCVPYQLPSDRVVNLRGKWDSVDIIEETYYDHTGKPTKPPKGWVAQSGIWLQENKTKSSIETHKIQRMLRFDLQTMLYIITLHEHYEWSETAKFPASTPIKGVRYNVIRRSTHKTAESMVKKVEEDTKNGRAEEWFARWNVEISTEDITRFKNWTLHPILENVCDDYEWFCYIKRNAGPTNYGHYNTFNYKERTNKFPDHKHRHFVMPYIGYNPLSEGGESDVDNYLFTGREIGLQRITHDDLFPELS
jgi:hypothetical protein